MKRQLLVALFVAAFLTACGGEKRTLLGYWDGFEPEAVYDNVDGAQQEFKEWGELLAKADTTAQKSAIEDFVAKVCADEVCYYIYTEWAMGHLYGIWSPVRNEFAFEHLLRTLMNNVSLAAENYDFVQLLDILAYNRVGEMAEDFVIYSPAGQESRLSDYRGRPVVMVQVDITCPSCVDVMTEIESNKGIMKAAESGDITLLLIAVGQIPESIGEFAAHYEGTPWQVRCTPRGNVERAHYDADASPSLFVIDEEGVLEVGMTRNVEQVAKAIL
jgi:hypothetical protein